VGWTLNHFRAEPLPVIHLSKAEMMERALQKLSGFETGTSSIQAGAAQILSLEEFTRLVGNGRILDARPEAIYQLGHVPGAMNLPLDNFQDAYTKNRQTLEADKHQAIVVYCSDAGCKDSSLLREALVTLGFTDVRIFKGGWEAWEEAGMAQGISP
jgi:rhodanese-related sulfurtransferase